jgi:hypothetical protein
VKDIDQTNSLFGNLNPTYLFKKNEGDDNFDFDQVQQQKNLKLQAEKLELDKCEKQSH